MEGYTEAKELLNDYRDWCNRKGLDMNHAGRIMHFCYEKFGNSSPSESQSVVDNEDEEKSSVYMTGDQCLRNMAKILKDAGYMGEDDSSGR